ncbi:MAG: isoprenylcysteine carboxylmethyltransferase family protein [Acidobacteria bacterium]|nr:isoprenylcysteine carboxylmethyltransferase family protein [Acidobacteriota bacterium]
MVRVQLLHILGWIWTAFGVYWIAAGIRSKPEQTSEPPIYRVLRLIIVVIVFALLFDRWTAALGWLGSAFPAHRPLLAYIGFVLALAGIALAMWARIHLGQFWSDKVVLKVDHQLVRTGPYAYLRHPIYSGVLLGVAATALVLGEWRGVVAFLILLVNYCIKARREDRMLAGQFQEGFAEHEKHAGFLLPKFERRA